MSVRVRGEKRVVGTHRHLPASRRTYQQGIEVELHGSREGGEASHLRRNGAVLHSRMKRER